MKNLFSLLLLTVLQINTHVSHAEMIYEKVEHPLSMRSSTEINYFPSTDEIILFGGHSGQYFNDIWAFRDNKWVGKELPEINPSGRSSYGMSYNGSELLMFGGYDSIGSHGKSDELWSWDGAKWTFLEPETTCPLPRYGHAMAYDFYRERLVMFSGVYDVSELLDEIWEWDGIDWELKEPISILPSSRRSARMVYFEPFNSVVMFGGSSNGVFDDDLWQWDGVEWQILPTGPDKAPGVTGHQLVYDTKWQRLIMYGGYNSQGVMDEIWEWDGAIWNDLEVMGTSPPPRQYFAMTYDPVNDQFIIFGGIDEAGDLLNDTWIFKDGQWTQIEPEHPSPCYRREPAMAYDSIRDQSVLFGGRTQKGLINDTWMWNGSYWSQLDSDQSPPAATFSRMVFDEQRNQIVMMLRFDEKFEIWECNGTDWRIAEPVGDVPVDASGFSLIYDSVRDVTVMFGGYIPYDTTNKLWEWDGEYWTPIEPDASFPQPRDFHQAAFDDARGRMVVFGGWINRGEYMELTNETWEWDGNEWFFKRNKGSKPGKRSGHTMVYDSQRRRVILYGGDDYALPEFEDTWEWDGVKWLERTPETGPGQKYYHAMAYDSRRHRAILFGGEGTDYSNDTWEYYNADTECCDTLGVTLDLSQTEFHPGDPFSCTATVCNNTGAELPDMPLFVLLEVVGQYYFGPTFSESVDTYLDGNPTYPENETEVDVIPPFTWPEGAGSFHGAYFHAALTDPDMTFLYGAMDSVEFGWE